jgi:hypothetical protein
MIQLLSNLQAVQNIADFFSEQEISKVVEDHFLFGLEDRWGTKFVVLKTSFKSMTWAYASVYDLTHHDLYTDEDSCSLRDFLAARISDGFEVFAFEEDQSKEYLLWLAE